MKRCKIMHLTYDMRIGGTEMVIKNIIEGSDKNHFDMSIFCIEQPLGPWGVEMQQGGLLVEGTNRKPGFDFSLIKTIREKIKQHDIDILHCHQYTPYIYGILAALASRTKVVFTEHGRFYPDTSSWKRRLLNPLIDKFTFATTAISEATKQALVVFENIPAKRIKVIYNGIAPLQVETETVEQLRKTLNIGDKTLCLGTVARLDPIKNHIMMLDAFKQVIDKGIDAKLMIVGDGEERTNIESHIHSLGLQQHVILTGYESQPKHHLALMDIYLLSSLSEGTSMTLLEAMSLGKPCVVTNAGGNPEIIKDGENGLVTANGQADEFAAASIKLCLDAVLRQKMGQVSKSRFLSHFHVEIMQAGYQKIYLNFADKRRP